MIKSISNRKPSSVMNLKPLPTANWFIQDHKSLRNGILRGRKLPPPGTAFTYADCLSLLGGEYETSNTL